jgi:hypothetical protein
MQNKDLIALMLIPVAILGVTAVLSFSRRAREIAFFALVGGLVVATRLDINFGSLEWYRGTTRGFEFSFVDVLSISLVLSSIFFPLPGNRRFFWPASLGLVLLYFFYCCFSVGISEPRIFGMFELSKVLRALLCFLAGALYVQSEREIRIMVFGLACALFYEGILGFKQRYADGMYRVEGTLDHSNSLSIYLLMVTPIMIAAFNSHLPKWLRWFCLGAIGSATVGEFLTASRLGIPAYGVVMTLVTLAVISWKITLRKIAVTGFVLLAVAAMMIKAGDIILARYQENTLEGEYDEKGGENRGHYLRLAAAIVHDNIFGVGLNNWSYWTSKKYYRELGISNNYMDYDDIPESLLESEEIYDWSGHFAAPAHNLGAITAGELGIPGLIIFALLWMRWFWVGGSFLFPRVPDPMRRIAVGIFFGMVGVFLQSLTEWVFRQTAVMLTFYLLFGAMARLYSIKKKEKRFARAMEDQAYDRYEFSEARDVVTS